MAIRVHHNQYIAPTVERQPNETNKFEGLSSAINNIAKVGGQLYAAYTESQEEAVKQAVNKELSEYNVQSQVKLKELKSLSAPNIEESMKKWAEDYNKYVLDRNKDRKGFDKLWNSNVYRVNSHLSASIFDAKLETDAVNEANDRNITFENNITSTRIDPNLFRSNTGSSFDAIDKSKFMSLEARNKEFDNVALQQQTTAYLATVDKSGVEEANASLLNGDFNYEYTDILKKTRSYDLLRKTDRKGNSIAATLVKSAEDSNFSAILESGDLALLQATKEQFDNSDRFGKGDTYSLGKVGTIWDKQEKEHNYNLLKKAIKNQQLTLDDKLNQTRVDLVIAAKGGDYAAAQHLLSLANNGDKKAANYLPYLKETVPELCETKEEAFRGFADKLAALAAIDISEPVSEGISSGATRYKEAVMDILKYIDDRNQVTKDLSAEDAKDWEDMVISLNGNIGQNMDALVDGMMTAKAASNSFNMFRIQEEEAEKDAVIYSNELTGATVYKSPEKLSARNKKAETFIANKYVRRIFEIEKRYGASEDPLAQQRRSELLKEAKETFLTERRLQVAPELYWADSTSNYKIHEVGDTITINNRNYVLKGYEGLIFPILSQVKK